MRRPSRFRSREGFTLAEMVIALAVIAMLAAIILVQVANQARRGSTAALAQSLSGVSSAVLSFRGDVRHYPATLTELTRPLVLGDVDACGGTLATAVRNRWAGPYLQRAVPATGVPAGDATILNGLVRSPATANPGDAGTLYIIAANVDRQTATELEAQFDGNADFTGGSIRWVSGGAAGDTLKYAVPVTGC
ncbi:MAG TPA: type II secretion system protein [Longimicrobiales bacterium]|nr:type II secretion system protein [Longimicrobiales bacterium]